MASSVTEQRGHLARNETGRVANLSTMISDLSIKSLDAAEDFAPLMGKTISNAEAFLSENGFLETLYLYFSDGSWMRLDGTRGSQSPGLICSFINK